MNKQKKVRKHTFTLVELLVVLLILGVLVGLAVPRYMEAQKNARFRTFTANVREIQSTLEVYRMDQSTATAAHYPADLSALESYFTQQPINPYTGKSMLSDNPEESGLLYENHDNDYMLCVTQLDVDDVNNNGNRNESIPVASHVGETFRSAQLFPLLSGSDVTGGGITLDRTFICTTTIKIDPANELSAFQTAGDVSTNGNYMICASGCEATTKDTFMIGSNNADDSVIEFTVNIPEIETGRIEIGLKHKTDFYLRYDGDSHTMHLFTPYWEPFHFIEDFEIDGWYTGTHTFRFEFHHGKVGIKVDNEVLFPEFYLYGRLFNENGTKFFVRNINTNADVQIGTIAITINEYKFATTGTYISPIYDISTLAPNLITGTTDVQVNFYDFDQFWRYTVFTFEYQLSLDGGATWGDWQPMGDTPLSYNRVGDSVYPQLVMPIDFPKNISLENARIRLRVTLSTNNTKFSPEILDVRLRLYNALAHDVLILVEPFLKNDFPPGREFVNLVTLAEIYEYYWQ